MPKQPSPLHPPRQPAEPIDPPVPTPKDPPARDPVDPPARDPIDPPVDDPKDPPPPNFEDPPVPPERQSLPYSDPEGDGLEPRELNAENDV